MKQPLKSDMDVLNLINKIQTQLMALDKKVDLLIQRPSPETKLSLKPSVNIASTPVKHNDRNRDRVMHKAICADCNKECTIPFKPSPDRPVYCKDCFSRRKVISLSGIKVNDKPAQAVSVPMPVVKEEGISKPKVKGKKKAIAVKKPVGKKKPVPKKK